MNIYLLAGPGIFALAAHIACSRRHATQSHSYIQTHQYLFYDQLQLIDCNNNNHFHIFIKTNRNAFDANTRTRDLGVGVGGGWRQQQNKRKRNRKKTKHSVTHSLFVERAEWRPPPCVCAASAVCPSPRMITHRPRHLHLWTIFICRRNIWFQMNIYSYSGIMRVWNADDRAATGERGDGVRCEK